MHERTFHIMTFGCQMNVNDSDWLARALEARGFTQVPEHEAAIYIINTCSVRDKPEQKVYSLLGRIRRETKNRRNVTVCVGGCVAQQIGKGFFKRFSQVRLVFGTDGAASAPQAIERLVQEPHARISLLDFSEEFPERDAGWENGEVPVSAYVNIMQGCNNFCAYCIVPYTRGRQKSRSSGAVLDECRTLVGNGAREITLLGQNVNSYGLDPHGDGTTFARLLHDVAAIPGLERLRFMTPHPKDIAGEVIEAFGALKNLCPRVHLPLQSGSDRVLKAMGRKYDMARYMDIVTRLKAVRPDIQITSDLIVGFPGETEADFEQTLEAMRTVPFVQSFSFIYSDRPGTRAEMLPVKLSREEKTARLVRLQEVQNEYSEAALQAMVGKTVMVLFESPSPKSAAGSGADAQNAAEESGRTASSWQGRDEHGFILNVHLPAPADLYGKIMPVTVTAARKHSLTGEPAGESC
ncbi:tRNA (N6-isopentenyl adenosine(37)-C2)-methylthiotransferase MiaB [Oleidesulfovibrio alaskensis]|uniref:tRNA (N6-isopentenyl adenosine(37)-C2)-methylthiotransferase MiaB n=1 Tax=Oleidesulfovibrio alaskensis TaxID=58180 RepID=UPI001A3B7F8D|nr:tRNA (N6-isopentenyl adenosine(37)-C2)-methylthiotransferase MiaB [Oleidesulfovibrio alaskensis]MBL3581697.1 tRNA (N6-isopentenyl adenosine(37)-C2)-methylthiotransferase MiaB [Oleidesulfovibrio alaskensis]